MSGDSDFALWMLEQEARSLLTRLNRVKPFALQESMLPAANLLPESQIAIERFLMAGRRHLRTMIERFIDWLRSPEGSRAGPEESQRRFTVLRLRFNSILTQFDMFDHVITQRSESETGVWLSGLDVLSADALRLREQFFEMPPIICYLDRGVGAAIRRARTRMPGGGDSPVAIVRIPRERMVGSGIASSLVHEVGHQAAALLGLVESLRPVLRQKARTDAPAAGAWRLWERWISEIVADFWSVARVGVASTIGLMAVVSLPRAFVFRINEDDPHPVPWIRVKLSAAIGGALYPQPVWRQLSELWESYYPIGQSAGRQAETLQMLEQSIPDLISVLIHHRPASLKGKSILEVLDLDTLMPEQLRAALRRWRESPQEMYDMRPSIVMAVIGQGRADGMITPEEESNVLGKLLAHWALAATLQAAAGGAQGSVRCGCQTTRHSQPNLTTTRRATWQIQ